AVAVQALAVGQHAVVQHRGGDARALDLFDPELHQAVVEQKDVAAAHVLRQAEVADADLGGVPGRRVGAGHEVEALARAQLHPAFGEALDAQLGPGQVGEDADLDADRGSSGAHRVRARHLRFRLPVREVEPHHVHAGTQQRLQHARRVGCGTERGDDPRPAPVVAHRDLALSAEPAGSSLPSRPSTHAPPPVETEEPPPAPPDWSTAARPSPPPATESASDAAMARASTSVPFANASNSNTPTGPFQTTVPALPAIAA